MSANNTNQTTDMAESQPRTCTQGMCTNYAATGVKKCRLHSQTQRLHPMCEVCGGNLKLGKPRPPFKAITRTLCGKCW